MGVNRYSNIIQPGVVSPISFEEFARVPMARHQATAEALSATSGIMTDYDVDAKDLNAVTTAVSAIDESKNSLVDNILNSGVNNNTINEFMQVKQTRDRIYKDFVDKAQLNKRKLDVWRSNVDKMYAGIDPSYAEKIKQKEYAKWTGTLKEDPSTGQATYTDFIPSNGVKYHDVEKDVQNVMSRAARSTSEEDLKGSYVMFDKRLGQYVLVNKSGKIVTSNESQIAYAANMLAREYNDQNTDRGRFANYADVDQPALINKINDYLNIFTGKSERSFGGEKRYIGGPSGSTGTTSTLGGMTLPTERIEVSRPTADFKKHDVSYFKNISNISSRYGESLAKGLKKLLTSSSFSEAMSTMKKIAMLPITVPKAAATEKLEANPDDIIKAYPEVVNKLITEGKINKDLISAANKGNKVARHDISMEVIDYIKERSKGTEQPTISGIDYLKTAFGNKIKNDPDKALDDLFANIKDLEVRKLTDRDEPLSKEDKIDLSDPSERKNYTIRGVHNAMSPTVLDSKGKYLNKISQGISLINEETGEEYIVERLWEPNTDGSDVTNRYKRNSMLEQYVLSAPAGLPLPIAYRRKDGQWEEAEYMYDVTQDQSENRDQIITSEGTFRLNSVFHLLDIPFQK